MKRLRVLAVLLAVHVGHSQTLPAKNMPDYVVVFSVTENRLEPIVVVRHATGLSGERYVSFRAPEDVIKVEPKLYDRFYKPGNPPSLFSYGNKRGEARITRGPIIDETSYCSVPTGEFRGDKGSTLATTTTKEIPGHAPKRQLASEREVAALRDLASRWLLAKGVDASAVSQAKMGPAVSTVLRNTSGRAVIARFDVTTESAVYRLLAVAESEGERYQLTLANLEVQRDIEDGVDRVNRTYVDQLDIDNDGIDDIITKESYYENWTYSIWRFDPDTKAWNDRYTGGGCGG